MNARSGRGSPVRKGGEDVTACIPAREVVLRFRNRRTGETASASVVCPARWTKSRLLAYARREHPAETVRVAEWKPVADADNRWRTRLWLVNPDEMAGG